ncbi:D-alanyl-D-alanine carboxypeptidase/D-alanyl-D-alanine-endopeptidase [soil metagenome]
MLRLTLFSATLVILLVFVMVGSSTASETGDVALRGAIGAVFESESLPPGFYGAHVVDVRTGEVVYSRNADIPFTPASTLKVLTTATALDALGPDYRFETALHFMGNDGGGVLNGDLVMVGRGDPTFGSLYIQADSVVANPLRAWANALYQRGVRRIEGRLIGDGRFFIEEPYPASWEYGHVATEAWAQSAGGLSYRDNLVRVQFSGGELTTIPEDFGQIINETADGSQGGGLLRVRRVVGSNTIRISGRVPSRYAGTVRVPIERPSELTMASFADQLRKAGIDVQAQIFDAAMMEEPPSPDGDPIFLHHSPPLIEILGEINRQSNNFYAEQVLRALGGGSMRAGIRRQMTLLQAAGVNTQDLVLEDGSGLSRKNMITPEAMTSLLRHMYSHEYAAQYLSTIPEGGQPRSTMRFRLGGVPVRAKTGAINYVRGLVGYVDAPDGSVLAFALFANQVTTREAEVGRVINETVVAMTTGQR